MDEIELLDRYWRRRLFLEWWYKTREEIRVKEEEYRKLRKQAMRMTGLDEEGLYRILSEVSEFLKPYLCTNHYNEMVKHSKEKRCFEEWLEGEEAIIRAQIIEIMKDPKRVLEILGKRGYKFAPDLKWEEMPEASKEDLR